MIRTVLPALGLATVGMGLFALPALSQSDTAQDDTTRVDTVREDSLPGPKRYEGATWNTVYLYDFEAGKEGRAIEILGTRLLPAYKRAGVPAPRVVELQTGPWDVMLISEMEEGPSEMTWQVPPEAPKIRRAMQQMLGKEKAGEITAEYGNAIMRSTSFVGMSGRHGAPITDVVPD